jgi:hypothetical protein
MGRFGRNGMNSGLVWAGFTIAVVFLGFVGYHFAVRTLRFVTLAVAAAVVVLITRYGITHPARGPTDLVNAFTRGASELSAAFFQPLLPGRHIPAPGRIGWLVIIVALVFAYRELEVWAMRWQPPTVDTSRLDSDEPGDQERSAPGGAGAGITDAQRSDGFVAELRFRLQAVQVRAPAILPGDTMPNALASIAENSGIDGGGLAGAIIRFVGMLWPNPRRYRVRFWVEPTAEPTGRMERATTDRRVTVNLEDPQTGGSIATNTLSARDLLHEGASAVAGYVAQQIFMKDPTAPPWSVGSFEGVDLAAMLLARQRQVPPESLEDAHLSRRMQINILERAVSDSPGAGVARYELAHLYDLEGYHVRALRLHVINRSQYPRFWRGRYRLGMSLEMIANPVLRIQDEEAAHMREILRALDRCRVTYDAERIYDKFLEERLPGSLRGELPRALREELLIAAQSELRIVRRQLTLWRVIWAMFCHRDERMIRRPYLRLRERQSFHDGARVAELLVAVRQSLLEEKPGRARRDSHSAKRAMKIVAAITGDSAAIQAVLNPTAQNGPKPPRQLGPNAERTRWLPWQRRTPSWEAAYNAACLYAALDQERDHMAEQAVVSLTRAVTNRDRGAEPPWDWISTDPDLAGLRLSAQFRRFLEDLWRKDYPMENRKSAHH